MPEKTEETPAEEAVELATYVVVGCTIDGVPEGDTIEMNVKKAAMHVRRGRLKLKVEVDDGDDRLRGDDRDGGDAAAVRREQHQRDDAGDDE